MKHFLTLSLLLPAALFSQAAESEPGQAAIPHPEAVAEDTTYPVAGSYYTIENFRDAGNYMTDDGSNNVVTSASTDSEAHLWEFVPTENEHCYYIRNVATGKYIQSCNQDRSSTTPIPSGDTPVEYYVGYNNTSGSATYGAYYLSSTDNSNYADPDQDPNALNKVGGGENVVVWGAQQSKVGSYWRIALAEETSSIYPLAGRFYTIDNASVANSYISEEADGSMVVFNYDNSVRCFWEFIPTENEHCYYIRNAVTGKYIQSCNKSQSSASTMKTGTQPVEYYIGYNETSGTASFGYFYLSSTDNSNYADPSKNPNALNKDGGSSNVIVWGGQKANKGSYWRITETELNYEVKPFMAVSALGNTAYPYDIVSLSGKYLLADEAGELSWVEKSQKGEHGWYFVGESNQDGGYLIANLLIPGNTLSNEGGALVVRPEETATRWSVFEKFVDGTACYYFRPSASAQEEGTALTVAGDSLFLFRAQASAFARAAQIYQQPCGQLGSLYISGAEIQGEAVLSPLNYPLSELRGSVIRPQSAQPASWYTLFTRSKAEVAAGKSFELHLSLNDSPANSTELFVYFDWDRDGVFETMQKMEIGQENTAVVEVPAGAAIGKSRMRCRLTENGFSDAEDEVAGQIIDFVISVKAAENSYTVTAVSNAAERGSVKLSPEAEQAEAGTEYVATATPLGNAEFLCWKEGHQVLSVSEAYTFTVSRDVALTAVFTPNTDDISGISSQHISGKNVLVTISAGQNAIDIETAANFLKARVYNPAGALLLESSSKHISTQQLPAGTYIVKVYTDKTDADAKIFIR